MGVDHFCQPLHVAMQLGLSHQHFESKAKCAWRIVSEDPTTSKNRRVGFLLIVCTDRIFTAMSVDRAYARTHHEYRRILRVSSIWPGFTKASVQFLHMINLRTVIVTAAVYWGFGRQLLREDNRLP